MSHFGHGSKPAKRAGETDHTSLFEASLIPLADHADDSALAAGDVGIGDIEIAPAPTRQKIFTCVKRSELLSGIVVVQAVDDLREKDEAAAFDVAIRVERWLGAAEINAGAVEAAHGMISGQSSAPRRECGQCARILRKDGGGIEHGAVVGMQFLQETVSTGEQAAAAIVRTEA